MIFSEPQSISPVRLQRSVNQHYTKLPAMATAGTLENPPNQKTTWRGILQKRGRNIKIGIFLALSCLMANHECQLRAEYSILPVWHTEWAFQRQTWEENVCSSTVRQPPQRALFHQNTGCIDHGWTMKKKQSQMADKDRPCTPLRFLLSTPVSVFNFQIYYRMEEVGKGLRPRSGEGEGEE